MVDIQWMSNEGYQKRMLSSTLGVFLIFTLVGVTANWAYEGDFLGPLFLLLFLFGMLCGILPGVLNRYEVPQRVGIWEDGVIINSKTEIREYNWEELALDDIKWPQIAEFLEEKKFFGRTYYVKNEIVQAVVEKWEEIRSIENGEH